MTKDDFQIFYIIFGALLVVILSIPVWGAAISLNWNWFVASKLHMPEISWRDGVGISIFSILFCQPPVTNTNAKDIASIASSVIMRMVGVPLLVTALGWIWHLIS